MLSGLRPASLARLRFPLAELTKPEVREIAAGRRPAGRRRRPRARTSASSPARASARFLARHGGLAERPGRDRRPRAAGARRAPRPSRLHRRPAPRARRRRAPSRSTCSPPTPRTNTVVVGSREELATRRVRVRERDLHRPGGRVDRVLLRYHSRPLACERPGVAAGRARRARARARRARLRRRAGPDGVPAATATWSSAARRSPEHRVPHVQRTAAMTSTGHAPRLADEPDEIRETFLSFFERARAPAPALGVAGAGARRHLDAAHRRRHAAAEALLRGPRGAAEPAPDLVPALAFAPSTSRWSARPSAT